MSTVEPLRVMIVARDDSPSVQRVQTELGQLLREHPDIELIDTVTADQVTAEEFEADVALVVGGDGAILRACRWMGLHQIPILGVNLGRLGFLADISESELTTIVSHLGARQYEVVSHLMFSCRHEQANGAVETYLGLNETALLAGASLSLIDVELTIDGVQVTTYSGDGLILSTPVGSTAHNLSAGGPILRQDLQAFVVTPICPHTLTVRPIIDRANAEYVLTAPQLPPGVMLVIDGQIKVPFFSGERVVVRRAEVEFKLVKLPGHDFYQTLHRKLGWDGQPRYQRGRDFC